MTEHVEREGERTEIFNTQGSMILDRVVSQHCRNVGCYNTYIAKNNGGKIGSQMCCSNVLLVTATLEFSEEQIMATAPSRRQLYIFCSLHVYEHYDRSI